jgi:hypothetical protein
MPTHAGPNPALDSNIVFSYDVGDTSNSYRGEPTVNIAADLGLVSVALSSITYIGIEDGWKKYGLSGTWSSGTYPYAIALTPVTFTGGLPYCVRATVKTNVPNKFNYFGANGISYVNEPKDYEGTLSSTLNPDGSYTVTRYNFAYTNTTAQAGYLFTNPVDGATFNSSTDFVWVKEYQAEQKDHPTQFVNGTRSATQGLLPLINNPTINLSSVSFDSNAQIIWDGTDDTISINSYPAIELVDNVSIEYVYMRLSTDPVLDVIANKYHNTGWELFCQTGATFALAGRNGDGTYYATSNPAYTIQNNQYYHLVAIKDGFSWRLYVNGQLYSYLTAGTIGTWSNTGILQIGGEGSGYYPHMKLPIFKIYNTVLSADQVKQNYNQYKTRFNLS